MMVPPVEQCAQLQQHDAAHVEFQAGFAGFEHDQGQQRPQHHVHTGENPQHFPAAVDLEVGGRIPDEKHDSQKDQENQDTGSEMDGEGARFGHDGQCLSTKLDS